MELYGTCFDCLWGLSIKSLKFKRQFEKYFGPLTLPLGTKLKLEKNYICKKVYQVNGSPDLRNKRILDFKMTWKRNYEPTSVIVIFGTCRK